MNLKKVILLIIGLGIVMNPVMAIAQIGSIDDSAVKDFSEDISASWGEAKTIWRQMCDTVRPLWDRHIGGRIAPISNAIKKWVNTQTSILRDIFTQEKEKAGEVIKEEAKQAGESVSKSIWQTILEAVGWERTQ